MKSIIAGALLALVAAPTLAQTAAVGVLDQGGRNVYQFRSAEDRISRLAVAQEQEIRRRGLAAGSGGSGGAGGSALASATAINNYFQVTNTVDCSGTNVVCTGGANNVSGTTQTTTGSTSSADNVLTGNTVTNTQTTNNVAAPGGDQ